MKQLIVFIKKEFKHIFRDTRTLLILFGMPIAQVFLFGYAITNEVRDAEIAVWDQSEDFMSNKLTDKILASEYFRLAGNVHSYQQLEDGFREGKYKMALVIPPKFAADFEKNDTQIQLLLDASDPNMANILANYGTAIIQTFTLQEGNIRMPQKMITEVRMVYNPELKGVFLFVPGVITVILMLVSTLLTSIALTREKELGTMEIILVSPLKPLTTVLGKVIPYLILSFSNALVILIIGVTVFGMPINGSLGLLIFELILFILAALSLGILVSTKVETQQVAMMIALSATMLPSVMLSGFVFAVKNMPVALQVISYLIPARFFVTIIRGVMLKGAGVEILAVHVLELVGLMLFLMTVAARKFSTRVA
mgnify:CR=1 FL=1